MAYNCSQHFEVFGLAKAGRICVPVRKRSLIFAKDIWRVTKSKSAEFWDNLPKTGSGKIKKNEIRERYWEGYENRVH